MIAESNCIVCSGPLHDTWLGAVVGLFGFYYSVALLFGAFWLNIERRVPARGIAWRAIPLPFVWAWMGLRWSVVPFLPPERRPRRTRMQLEDRIDELERELEIGQYSKPPSHTAQNPAGSTTFSRKAE